MKSKKMLALILTLCLMITVLAPAASALHAAGENVKNVMQGENATTGYNWLDKLLVSAGETLGMNNTLRGEKPDQQVSLVNGKWVAVAADGSQVELTTSQLPAHIQALQELKNDYQPMDKVVAFVTLESAPTADSYSSIHDVPKTLTAELTAEQTAMAAAIEQRVLEGKQLTIVAQFTHLTNSLVIETEFANLEAIAAMQGVKSVFLSPTYEACKTSDTVYPATESSTVMSNVANVWQDLGYTGEGMTIAILDTGLDLDHPSFAADPVGALWTEEWLQEMLDNYDLQVEDLYAKDITAEDLYYNAKVPFAFNYASGTLNVLHNDGAGDHGTHVAGIAAANQLDGSGVVGMAPNAQIIVMKVFGSNGASMYTCIKALEDCMILGVDVANMSLGSPAGFSETDIPEIDAIFQRIAESSLIVDVAAGNEGTSSYGSVWGNNMQLTDHIDNGVISSPSTYANAMSVASVENNLVPADYILLADGTKLFYMSSVEVLYEYTDLTMQTLKDAGELEYVIVPGLGEEADFYDENGNSIVDGKIAVLTRGTLTFGQKIQNAENAGAIAAIIWNTSDEDIFSFGMTTAYDDGSYPGIPAILITYTSGQIMADAEVKTLDVPEDFAYRVSTSSGQMSTFSSWGTTGDLRLVPDLSGVGGNVYSCYDNGEYGLMSGTSMATPQVAGVTALVLQYLEEHFPEATASEIRTLVDSLLMSTAVPVIDNDSKVEASPRQQGAGLVDALAAITSEAYLAVEGNARPKAELKDNAEGEFTFTFSVNNFSDVEKTYNLRASLLCEDVLDYYGYYFIAEMDRALDNAAVTFSRDSVTVAPGTSEEVTVTIKLTEEDKQWLDHYFPNGNYIEGYIYLEGDEVVTMSLPFMGFYGNWADAPLFDEGFWYDDGFWLSDYGYITYNQYSHMFYTSLGAGNYDWVLGMNAYTGPQYWYDEDGNPHVYYKPENNVISPNGDGSMDQLTEIYLSLMRNAEELEMTYTDADGNVLDYRYFWKESKTMYISAYGSVVPWVYTWTYGDFYDFSDCEDGDVVYVTISGVIDYEGAETDILMENMPIYVDTSAPVLDTTSIVESSDENGNYITLTFTEAHPAAVITMNRSGSQIYDYYSDMVMTDNGDGTYTVTIDVTGLGSEFSIAICDYGCNEAMYDLTYTLVENNPEVDMDALYAYQVYHEYYYYNYGWDAMFGWATIDKTTAEATLISSDQYEYWALSAAEHVDGYVFGVDAGGNLLYMAPGLWNRSVIANIGLNVIDMAFDETTGTMYLATSDKANESYCLYTVDLLTGETTLLRDYQNQYDVPWAMTFVDGKLYCTKYYYGGIWEVDLTEGTFNLTAVTDEEGNKVEFKGSTGTATRPYYAQSMTYSSADGVIYWAYYNGDACELITINPTDWSCTATAMYWDSEYVGLLTLEDGGYRLPESTEVTRVVMSENQVILGAGNTHALSANALPWNLPAEDRVLTWTSSDDSIATVDGNGVVTAVGEGTAIITASCNGFEATCSVIVVNISGSMNAYKYYDGANDYGYWLDIDLLSATEQPTVASPVDFIAADYNGHNGLIYGYSEYGQCYWFDPATGEYGTLGEANSAIIPGDMAYDYSTGTMYVIDGNENAWTSTLYTLNLATGKLVEVATTSDMYVTLACTTEGLLYAISYDGILYELHLKEDDGTGGGGGVMPLSTTRNVSYMIVPNYVMQTSASEVYFAQTMCYDHNNDALLWLNPETACLYWLGGLTSASPYEVALGDPSGTGMIQYTGAYVVPETIEELPFVPVESVEADNVLVLVGETALPSVNVYPANATNSFVSEWYSINPEVAYVDDNGRIVGVSVGSTTIYATVVDTDENGVETWYDAAFTVTVKNGTDNIYGYLIGDLGSGDGYYWAELDDSTAQYEGVNYVYYNNAYMILYAAEYVDGKIYAYGFDPEDWSANFHFLTIDAETWSVSSGIDMGDGFPFVYDMAFDYTTGTMYAVAGPNDSATDLYYVNMATGELILAQSVEPMIMSLAIDENGTIYGMAASEEDYDPLTWISTYSNAMLYTLDPAAGTCELYMDTGMKTNMLASMAYDFDTGYIYWTALFRGASYEGGLCLIDLDEKAAYNLGVIGGAGAQITGLMVIADEYPEIPTELANMALTSTLEELAVGETVDLEMFLQPSTVEVETTWTSADESIATVDENGVVTGISAGTTVVTVSVTDGITTLSASCTIIVYGLDDFFITYDQTNGGFATISRPDSVVTLYPDEEGASMVTAIAMEEGVIYGYDKDNNLFITSMEDGFARTYIGNANIEVEENYSEHVDGYYTYDYYYEYYFTVRDVTWDSVNNRLLALGCYGLNKHVTCTMSSGYSYSYIDTLELVGGCRVYEVDLETGELIELSYIYSSYGDNYSGVAAMEMTDDGRLYIYSSYMDYISELDLETGIATDITTFQNLGVYGSSDGDYMAMTYDAATHSIYMNFTSNGDRYFLYSFDITSTSLTKVAQLSEDTMALGGLALNDPKYVPTLTVGSAEGELNEEVTVEVSISATTLAGYGVKIIYDHEALEIVSIQKGEDAGEGFFNGSKKTGKVTYATTYNEDVEGVIFTITFKVLAYGDHTVSLEVDRFALDDQSLFEVATVDGVITAEEPHVCEFGEWVVTTEPTCTEDGVETRTCACGETETRPVPATGHSYEAVVTEPTCTEQGYTTYTCHCGDSYVADYVDALGHSHEVTDSKEATCTEDGYTTYTCHCGDTYTETVPATGHSHEVTDSKEATCTEDGYTTYTCHCGDTYTEVVEAHGHSYVDGVCEHCGEADASNPPTGATNVLGIALVAMMSVTAVVCITGKKNKE